MVNINFFITGGSGFLGKNFIEILKKKINNKKFTFYQEELTKTQKIYFGLRVT